MLVSHTCILVHFIFYIITYKGDSIMKKTFSIFVKMTSFADWLQIQYGKILLSMG